MEAQLRWAPALTALRCWEGHQWPGHTSSQADHDPAHAVRWQPQRRPLHSCLPALAYRRPALPPSPPRPHSLPAHSPPSPRLPVPLPGPSPPRPRLPPRLPVRPPWTRARDANGAPVATYRPRAEAHVAALVLAELRARLRLRWVALPAHGPPQPPRGAEEADEEALGAEQLAALLATGAAHLAPEPLRRPSPYTAPLALIQGGAVARGLGAVRVPAAPRSSVWAALGGAAGGAGAMRRAALEGAGWWRARTRGAAAAPACSSPPRSPSPASSSTPPSGNWPWTDAVSLLALRLAEAGLLGRWREQFAALQERAELAAYRVSPRARARIAAQRSARSPAPLALGDVAEYVLLLAAGLALALCVCAAETNCRPRRGADDSGDSEDGRQPAERTRGARGRESRVLHVGPAPPGGAPRAGLPAGLPAGAAFGPRRSSCPGLPDVHEASMRVGFACDVSHAPHFRRRSCPEGAAAAPRETAIHLRRAEGPPRGCKRALERDFTDLCTQNAADRAAFLEISAGQNCHSGRNDKDFPEEDSVGSAASSPPQNTNPRIVINSPSCFRKIQSTDDAMPNSASLSRTARATQALFGSTVSLTSTSNVQKPSSHISDFNNITSSKTYEKVDETLQLDVTNLSLFGSQVSLTSICAQDQGLALDIDASNNTMFPQTDETITQSTDVASDSDVPTMSIFGSNGSLTLSGDAQCVVGQIPSLGVASVSATSLFMAAVPAGRVSDLKHSEKCFTIFQPVSTDYGPQKKSKSSEATDVVTDTAESAPSSNRGLPTDSRRNSKNVLPFFKKLEDFQVDDQWQDAPGVAALHARGGPIAVSRFRHDGPVGQAVLSAAVELGLPLLADLNGPRAAGVGAAPGTLANGEHCSAARGYLGPAARRANLHVLRHALASKVIVDPDSKQTLGVRFRLHGKEEREVRVGKEVVVSGGTTNSPQILIPASDLAPILKKLEFHL
ncbi:Glucose dehydrogenase [FAD, quinone] [Gryllus bimaculatus]|nr:Glucose dehydrogenase [FAD, quinone] [Gryllus bimaculatus]